MNKKADIYNVKIKWINRHTLVLISTFTHVANKSDGTVIDLRADNVLSQISSLAKTSCNEELLNIYRRIKREIELSLRDKNTSIETTKEVTKTAGHDALFTTDGRRLLH